MNLDQQLRQELNAFQPIVDKIVDASLRDTIIRLLTAKTLARLALYAIDLAPFEKPDYVEGAAHMWQTLSQSVRSALISLYELKFTLNELLPGRKHQETLDDVDIDFDLVAAEPVAAQHDTLSQNIDDWLQKTLDSHFKVSTTQTHKRSPQEEIVDAVRPLIDIIVREESHIRARLRNPNVVNDRWNLLADLQEFKGKFHKLLSALRVGLLHPFVEQVEELLNQDYYTELQQSITLRQDVTTLRYDVNRLVSEYLNVSSDDDRVYLLHELDIRMTRFARQSAFHWLRAPDKKCVIEFRNNLSEILAKLPVRARQAGELLEGFIRFLDALSAINRREVLIKHDITLIESLKSQVEVLLELSRANSKNIVLLTEATLEQARPLIGREIRLDYLLRSKPLLDSVNDVYQVCEWLKYALNAINH